MKSLSKKVRKAVVPAAGLGTRLLPATKSIPKELLPIIDAPTIHYIAEEAIASGIEELIIVTNGSKQAILDYFNESPKLEKKLKAAGKEHLLASNRRISDMLKITTVNQEEPKGQGHAVLMAREAVGDEPFAVISPDDIIDAKVPVTKQLIDIFMEYGPVAGAKRVPKEKLSLYGVAHVVESISERLHRIDDFVEKPTPETAPSNLANLGRYILTPDIFPILERTQPVKNNEVYLPDAFRVYAATKPFYVYEYEGNYYDTGDKLGLLEANIAYALKHPEIGEKARELLKRLAEEL